MPLMISDEDEELPEFLEGDTDPSDSEVDEEDDDEEIDDGIETIP